MVSWCVRVSCCCAASVLAGWCEPLVFSCRPVAASCFPVPLVLHLQFCCFGLEAVLWVSCLQLGLLFSLLLCFSIRTVRRFFNETIWC